MSDDPGCVDYGLRAESVEQPRSPKKLREVGMAYQLELARLAQQLIQQMQALEAFASRKGN